MELYTDRPEATKTEQAADAPAETVNTLTAAV
jgi:hypothetical protein